jgi:rsbT antagonist protein RsbS
MKIPILSIKGILLASIQEDLSDEDAIGFQQDVLARVDDTEACGVVVDITALDVVDSFMARVLNDTAHMARLMGAHVVICGMQPAVALTLVEMGRELMDVDTVLNLDQGMEKIEEVIVSNKNGSANSQ